MISFRRMPSLRKTRKTLERYERVNIRSVLDRYGRLGSVALSRSTPQQTGETAISWNHQVVNEGERYRLIWTNSVMAGQVPLVILIEYGHGTKHGGYVPPYPFINQALTPVINDLRVALISEVRR